MFKRNTDSNYDDQISHYRTLMFYIETRTKQFLQCKGEYSACTILIKQFYKLLEENVDIDIV